MDEKELVEIISDKSIYPEEPDTIRVIQTHISVVALIGGYVYKFKKPVDFGFLDFTTLEKRKFYCEEELRLNRRLSPDIYISLAELRKDTQTGNYSIDGKGELIDYCIKMKELPQDCLMNIQIGKGNIDKNTIDDIVSVLVDFYSSADTSREISEYGQVNSFRKNTDENFEQTENVIDTTITRNQFDTIKNATNDFYKKNEWLFQKRIDENKIRECHGDLHTGNIFIDNKIYIFDCIEFNKRFRYSDIAADIAFFAMDLDYLGREDLSKRLVLKFVKDSNDYDILKLINFYKCYYAFVRGKVKGFLLSDEAIPQNVKEESKKEAIKYFTLSEKYAKNLYNRQLNFDRPILMIPSSCSGAGKSYMMRHLAKMLNLKYLNTDIIRKELFKIEHDEKTHINFGAEIYSQENREKVYDLMFDKAEELLSSGKGCILDATFLSQNDRRRAMDIAEHNNAHFLIIHPYTTEDTIRKRITSRMTNTANPSDAGWEIYLKQKQLFEQFDISEKEHLIEVDSTKELCYESAFDKIVERLKENL